MKRVRLGRVGHFGLSVRDPKTSAEWWRERFDLKTMFEMEGVIGLSNDAITIVFHTGVPHPGTFQHMSFHCEDMETLRASLELLREAGVDVEDPGDEIGPEAPGSPHLALWFHDPDGYRWELSVQNGAKE
jgi:catechol 2,3-dioxygenase-like lactoylglutathione lyase family enzyme